jgi:DNA polymerase/3'-5' exonuclease PolX
MKLADAQRLAEDVRSQLAPFCERCEIAGSIRRRKAEVKDIEIVCIPFTLPSRLFGEMWAMIRCHSFIETVNQWGKVKGEPDGKYTQRTLPDGTKLDLFMATPDNWGLIFAIRTGSAAFSHHVLASTWTRQGYKSVGGVLMRNGQPTYAREERDLFTLLGLEWVEPELRK